jgi:hypothetical protein
MANLWESAKSWRVARPKVDKAPTYLFPANLGGKAFFSQ